MGTRDTRNQPALHELYFRDVQDLPLLTDAEVATFARQLQLSQKAHQHLNRAKLSPADARRLGQQVQSGQISYKGIEDAWPKVAARTRRYATRSGVALSEALQQVARIVLLLAERVAQGERARRQLIEGNVRLVVTIARRYV